jgi:hypothetical protein
VDDINGTSETCGIVEKCAKVLGGKRERNKSLGRHVRRLEDDIKMDHKEYDNTFRTETVCLKWWVYKRSNKYLEFLGSEERLTTFCSMDLLLFFFSCSFASCYLSSLFMFAFAICVTGSRCSLTAIFV